MNERDRFCVASFHLQGAAAGGGAAGVDINFNGENVRARGRWGRTVPPPPWGLNPWELTPPLLQGGAGEAPVDAKRCDALVTELETELNDARANRKSGGDMDLL